MSSTPPSELVDVAASELCVEVEFVESKEFGSAMVYCFKTVGVWPEDILAICCFDDGYIVCMREAMAAECMRRLVKEMTIDELIDFSNVVMPQSAMVLDESVPDVLTREITLSWNAPGWHGDKFVMFVNDCVDAKVSRWTFREDSFDREVVGDGFKIMRQ